MTIEITTEQCPWGFWSFNFTLNGKTYSDHDFSSRENALADARSLARTLLSRVISLTK